MFRKLFTVAALGVGMGASLFAVGCASESQKPYSVTGEQTTSERPNWQNPRYLDSKGHYHPEWVHVDERGHQ